VIGVDKETSIPDCITHVRTYHYDTTMEIRIDSYNNIRSLIFGEYFNESVIIPKNVTNLSFGKYFNQPVIIPNKVKYLIFGMYFNQPVIIPNNIKHLIFGMCFNQPVLIPKSVKRLIFGYYFDQPIYGRIPDDVEHLFYKNKTYTGSEIDIFRIPYIY
jgi:hypothetical protein